MKSLVFVSVALFSSWSAHTACPAAPVSSPDELVIQMKKQGDGTAAWAATNQVSATVEGSLVWDDANDAIAYCDGTSWMTLEGGAVGADNLGDHLATQPLDLNGFGLVSGAISVSTYDSSSRTTAFGMIAGDSNTDNWQSAFGDRAGDSNISDMQSAFGAGAGYHNTGVIQSAFGAYAGRYNSGNVVVAIGFGAAQFNTADNVIAIGYEAGSGKHDCKSVHHKTSQCKRYTSYSGKFLHW